MQTVKDTLLVVLFHDYILNFEEVISKMWWLLENKVQCQGLNQTLDETSPK